MSAKTKIGIFAFGCALVILIGYFLIALEVFPSNQLESTLRKTIAEKKGGTLNILDVTPFKWDRVDIYTPYTSFKDENGRRIDVDEGHCQLVFTNNGSPVATLKFKRYYGDFAGLHRKEGYTPATARFKVDDKNKGSWVKLEWSGEESPTTTLGVKESGAPAFDPLETFRRPAIGDCFKPTIRLRGACAPCFSPTVMAIIHSYKHWGANGPV